jgi:hypothetical protein
MQQILLAILQQQQSLRALQLMAAIVASLLTASEGIPLRRLLWILHGWLTAVNEEDLPLSREAINLLIRFERLNRQLAEQGEAAIQTLQECDNLAAAILNSLPVEANRAAHWIDIQRQFGLWPSVADREATAEVAIGCDGCWPSRDALSVAPAAERWLVADGSWPLETAVTDPGPQAAAAIGGDAASPSVATSGEKRMNLIPGAEVRWLATAAMPNVAVSFSRTASDRLALRQRRRMRGGSPLPQRTTVAPAATPLDLALRLEAEVRGAGCRRRQAVLQQQLIDIHPLLLNYQQQQIARAHDPLLRQQRQLRQRVRSGGWRIDMPLVTGPLHLASDRIEPLLALLDHLVRWHLPLLSPPQQRPLLRLVLSVVGAVLTITLTTDLPIVAPLQRQWRDWAAIDLTLRAAGGRAMPEPAEGSSELVIRLPLLPTLQQVVIIQRGESSLALPAWQLRAILPAVRLAPSQRSFLSDGQAWRIVPLPAHPPLADSESTTLLLGEQQGEAVAVACSRVVATEERLVSPPPAILLSQRELAGFITHAEGEQLTVLAL